MKISEMNKLIKHFDTYLKQGDCTVLHPVIENGYHIDVLLYKPTDKYPFWKLITMGASDYKMPPIPNTIGRFNEYIMFVDKDEALDDKAVVGWYHNMLLMIATYAKQYNTHITYGHSFEWENEDPNDEMVAAFIEFPQIVSDVNMLRCKLNMFKTVACLQVVLLNKAELEMLMEKGPEAFSEYLYPENEGTPHFLCEKRRSEKF